LLTKKAIDLLELKDREKVLREYLQQVSSNALAYGNGLSVGKNWLNLRIQE
jgi:hypothetical protein